MPDNYPPGWAPNAMMMLQLFATPEHYIAWDEATIQDRKLMMRVYATLGPWPNPIHQVVDCPPHGVQVLHLGVHHTVNDFDQSSSVKPPCPVCSPPKIPRFSAHVDPNIEQNPLDSDPPVQVSMFPPRGPADGPSTPPNADMFGWLENHSRFPEARWREALWVYAPS